MTNKWQRWRGIMKAYPFEEKRLAKWAPPFIVQPKYDGVRCRAIPIESTGEFILLSSEENVIYSVPHINKALSTLQLRAELDGELYCHKMKFEEIVSITSRTVNLHPNSPVIDFHVFDIVNPLPQMKRTVMIENLRNLHRSIKVAPFYVCENLDDIMKTYDSIINLGYEGIIVRHSMGAYERKRSTLVMKFKPKQEDEYEILGWEEERTINGSPKNSLGALVCKSNDGNTFNVGTGFSAEARQVLWNQREDLLGKVAKVKYQHLTTGKKVPRFPVFVEITN
uniref:Polydeoxyribonucleotide synthase [ATP] n=1 Tax=viral metagenome TaxID=1070528 RepID=A0A6M3JEJ8_9ZZZZ